MKFSLSYLGYLVIAGTSDHDCEEYKRSKNFPIFAPIEIVAIHDISPAVDSMFSKIDKMINDFQDNKSGWVFYENFRLDINIFKYNAIKGSSYIRLPDIISRKKACINIENNDEKCFLYSVCQHVEPQVKHAQRVTKHIETAKRFDSWKHGYPMKINRIPLFEKQFNLSINVYTYKINYNKSTKEETVSYDMLYKTPNIIEKAKEVISLLLIKEKVLRVIMC